MDNNMNGLPILSTLVEFFGIALGPFHQVVLYELDEKNEGKVVQVELGMLTAPELDDPMPKDLTHLLNRKRFKGTDYITGLTAVFGEGRIANMSILYLDRVRPQGKNYLLVLLMDSTEYYRIATQLLHMSNLDEKAKCSLTVEGMPRENVVHIGSILRAKELPNEPAGVHDTALSKIEAVIQEVMGKNAAEQSAFAQEKRMEIVERLYNEGIFNIKGMVRQVASRIFCSDATVYRYLSYIEK